MARDNMKRFERSRATALAQEFVAARNAFLFADYPASELDAREMAFRDATRVFANQSAEYFLGRSASVVSAAEAYQAERLLAAAGGTR